jgi:uncharacterized membrane protein
VSTVTKRLSWALALSIGLNLFLLGFGGSRWLRARSGHHASSVGANGPGRGHGAPRWMGTPSPALREQHRSLIEARRAVGSALEHEPYEATQLERALTDLRSNTAKSQLLLHERLLERAPALSPEERRELANSRFLRALPGDEPPEHRQ